MIKIYVGDITDEPRISVKKESEHAALITSKNCHNLQPGVYYLSLGDLPGIKEFVETLSQADVIVYSPPETWSDSKNDHESGMRRWTEFYLQFFNDKKLVISSKNLKKQNDFLKLVDHRQSHDPQLWIAGCSISHGIGVMPHERYGMILSKELKLPCSFLTQPGSSIIWAADQILRSDLRSGDILIWGLTSTNRLPYLLENKVVHVNINNYKNFLMEKKGMVISERLLDEDDLIYQCVTSVHRVLNFCGKIDVDVYFAGILVHDRLLPHLLSLPNYTQFYGYPGIDPDNLFIDIGSDGTHPGIQTHQWYAQTLLQKIKNRQANDKPRKYKSHCRLPPT